MTPMEELWEKLSRTQETGKKEIRYKSDRDLLYLYANGFVDHRKHTLDEWIQSFAECRQKDGSYRVTRPEWLAKEKYRYRGPVGNPFDPQKLQERDFTEAEFRAVFRHFICPSTWIPESSIPMILEHYRRKNKLVNGKIRIDKQIKKDLQELLDKVPSPLRMLQLDVQRVRGKGRLTVPPTPKSGYVAGVDVQKIAAARLAELGRSKPAPTKQIKVKEIPLKELKKRRPTPGRV